jgi:hypothetical protein
LATLASRGQCAATEAFDRHIGAASPHSVIEPQPQIRHPKRTKTLKNTAIQLKILKCQLGTHIAFFFAENFCGKAVKR